MIYLNLKLTQKHDFLPDGGSFFLVLGYHPDVVPFVHCDVIESLCVDVKTRRLTRVDFL